MDAALPVTLEVMLGALEKVCARTGAQLGTLPEKVTINTGSVGRTRNGTDGDYPDTWNREIVGDSPTLSQLHEGTKLEVLLLDGDLIPVLSKRAATMIVAQYAMWLDTKKKRRRSTRRKHKPRRRFSGSTSWRWKHGRCSDQDGSRTPITSRA